MWLVGAAVVLTGCAVEQIDRGADFRQSALEFREAGFGPGGLAFEAGAWVGRLGDVNGEWTPGLTVPQPVPDICGIPEPSALQARSLARFAAGSDAIVEIITVEARVYESGDQAQIAVEALNGESAAECDQINVGRLEELSLPRVRYDFGDGVGAPIAVAAEVPSEFVAESRVYGFSVSAGFRAEDIAQRITTVVQGRTALTIAVLAPTSSADALEAQVLSAFFDRPTPELSEAVDFDELAEEYRDAALEADDLPEDFLLITPLRFDGPSGLRPCLDSQTVAGADGLSWVLLTQGAGSSQIEQSFERYASAAEAEDAFDELVERGASCLPVELSMNDAFDPQTAATEVVEAEGREVVIIDLEIEQLLSGQIFDVQASLAATQVDDSLYVMEFFGLPSDAPDLASLVVAAAS